MREFESGATRDTDEDKLDYEGHLCPLALERYAAYMHAHRKQADGEIRASDNWQRGLPIKECVKSILRHLVDLWKLNRGYIVTDQKDSHYVSMEEACCAIIFNNFSILSTLQKKKIKKVEQEMESIIEEEANVIPGRKDTYIHRTSPSQQPNLGSIPNTPLGPAPQQYGDDF